MTDNNFEQIKMEKLQQEAEEDLKFSIVDAEKIALNIPMLKNKYSRYLFIAKGVLKNSEMDLKKIYAKKHKYYSFDHNIKFNRGDVPHYIHADSEYQQVEKKVELNKLRVEYLDNVLKSIDQMSFTIPAAIKMHIFMNGG